MFRKRTAHCTNCEMRKPATPERKVLEVEAQSEILASRRKIKSTSKHVST